MKESQLDNKTTIATNDYVRMVDENNNSVKIKKDSFMAAIRDALPSIISDGETNVGSVLSIIDGALKTRTDANLASVLGVDTRIQILNGSNDQIYSLGKIGMYSSVRIIGSNFSELRGVVDVTIYGNGGNEITARGSSGSPNYQKMKCYKDSGNNVYIKFPTGLSTSFIVIGVVPVRSALPSDASELTITSYEN